MAKYGKAIVKKITDLIKSDSYTIAEICQMVGITESTYHDWKAKKPEFSESIKKAQESRMQFFVAEAKKSLIKKIQGYTVQEKKVVTVPSGKPDENGKQVPKIKEHTVIDKHYQPDTAAIIFTLTNGDPENWKNRQNVDANIHSEPFAEMMKRVAEKRKQANETP